MSTQTTRHPFLALSNESTSRNHYVNEIHYHVALPAVCPGISWTLLVRVSDASLTRPFSRERSEALGKGSG